MTSLAGLTLKHLRCLAAVAEHRSLTAAAEALHLTTPAIHSQINGLEEQVGRPVLERTARDGFRPTPVGLILLRAARRIDANVSQARADLAALARGLDGHVTLSVVSTAQYFVPRLVRMLHDRVPEISVGLRVGNREAVTDDLATGIADLAIMGRPPRVPPVISRPLGPHPHGIILAPDHPLAGAEGFDPAALMEETFLAREEGSGTRILMMRYLDRIGGGHLPQLIEMNSNETIKQSVMAGLGIAFLSLHTVCEELAAGRLRLLRGQGLPVMRQWYLVQPRDDEPTPAALRIAREIEALAGACLPRPCCDQRASAA